MAHRDHEPAGPPRPGDDLPAELSHLEARLAGPDGPGTDRARLIDELSRVREGLAHRADRHAPLRLADLRIASPCRERWADMVGDDRVRVCHGCDRPVFDLSEMTEEEAEAVLATRGITPCVRFYRRADGTVMTADCPTGARRSRRLAVVAGTVAAGTAFLAGPRAMADPPPLDAAPASTDSPPPGTADPPPEAPQEIADPSPSERVLQGGDYWMGIPSPRSEHRPTIEWSTWFRLGFGAASEPVDTIARGSTLAAAEQHSTWETALGADLTLPVGRDGNVRLGTWAEVRTSSGPVVGGELVLDALPRHLDLFQFDGEGTLQVRAGGNAHVGTAALAYGYLAPWSLSGPWEGASRYMIGVRLVVSATRSLDDPHDWSATVGLEVEPIGALRYLMSIRAWY